jgi:hypothetical protein
MTSDAGFLGALVREAVQVLAPLRRALEDAGSMSDLLRDFGWLADPSTLDITAIRAVFDVGDDLVRLDEIARQYQGASVEDLAAMLPEAVALTTGIFATLRRLSLPQGSTPGFPFLQPEFWQRFPEELVRELPVAYLERFRPALFGPMVALGLIEEEFVHAAGAAGRTDFVRRRVAVGAIERLADARRISSEVYGWGTNDLHRDRLVETICRFAQSLGLPAIVAPVRPDLLDAYYPLGHPDREEAREARVAIAGELRPTGDGVDAVLSVLPFPAVGQTAAGLAIAPSGEGVGEMQLGYVRLGLETSGVVGDRLELRPDSVQVVAAGGTLESKASLSFSPPDPVILVGSPQSHRLQCERGRVELEAIGPHPPAVTLRVAVDQLTFVLEARDIDGFLARVLGDEPKTLSFDATLAWSSRSGLHFDAGGLRVVVPLNLRIAAAELRQLTLALGPGADRSDLTVSFTASVGLGPIAATIEDVGIGLKVTEAPAGEGGMFGGLDPELSFNPPTGVGMVINTPGLTGGGHVHVDPVRGLYAGVLQLEITGVVSVTAIALITTKLPDGSRGYSLLVVIAAEFPPIQLGFGFTLTGIGGVLGANRTMAVDALRDGVRSGALDSLLFPPNPVEHADKVIADLSAIFPPAPGRFVLGLMAQLGWGTPNFIRVDLGIIIEVPLPIRIALIGRLSVALPPGAPIAVVRLQLDLVGILDLGRGEASVDAILRDSSVYTFPITGQFAARIGWGARPQFALSAGGLHPKFAAPPGFPALERVAIALSTRANPRLRLEAYLAVTSNTVQFGARLDAYAEIDTFAGTFSASGELQFDALVRVLPRVSFTVDLRASVTIRRKRKPLFGADVRVTLSGPSPFEAHGEAIFDFLGERRIPIDLVTGAPPDPVELAPVDPLGDLLDELGDIRNWAGALPGGGSAPVGLVDRATEPEGEVAVHPLGALTVRQRRIPLKVRFDRYQERDLGVPVRFMIDEVTFGDAAPPDALGEEVRDPFASGAFLNLSDSERLARPAFESYPSGRAKLSSTRVTHGAAVEATETAFETIVIDGPDRLPTLRYLPHADVFTAYVAASAAGRAPLVTSGASAYAGPPLGIALRDPKFTVADRDTLAGVGTSHESYTEAADAVAEAEGAARLQIVGSHEAR